MSRTVFGKVGVTVEIALIRTGSSTPCRRAYSVLVSTTAARAVGGRADVEQVQRVGDDRGGQHVLDADLLAVAGVGVLQAVAGVLDLDPGEVLRGGAVQVHPAARVHREVRRVGHAEQPEPQPVRVVPALAGVGGEEALGRGVRADDERDLATGRPGSARGRRRAPARRWRTRRTTWRPGRRSSPAPGRTSRRRRTRRSRCARSRRRRPGRRRASRRRRRRARRGRRARRTRRSCAPTCPTGACRRRGRRRPCCSGRSLVRLLAHLGDGLPAPDRAVAGRRRCRASRRPARPRRRRAGRRRRTRRRPGRARPAPRAARRRRARTARRGRCAGCTAAAAGTGRRCRTRPCRGATARPPRTPRPRSAGLRQKPAVRGKNTVPQLVHRVPSSAGSAPVVNQPSIAGVAVSVMQRTVPSNCLVG